MSLMKVSCPHCGTEFEVRRHNKAGTGAHYGKDIRVEDLAQLDWVVLEMLEYAMHRSPQGVDRSVVWESLHPRVAGVDAVMRSGQLKKMPTKNGVSGRLSEMAGMRPPLTSVARTRKEMWDTRRKSWGYVNRPLWSITGEGRRVLAEHYAQRCIVS